MDEDDNVIDFTGYTVGDIPPDSVLEGATGKLKRVIIIGVEDTDDMKYYFATSGGSNAEVLWDVEQFKLFLLEN